jgi:hypothetical protein
MNSRANIALSDRMPLDLFMSDTYTRTQGNADAAPTAMSTTISARH